MAAYSDNYLYSERGHLLQPGTTNGPSYNIESTQNYSRNEESLLNQPHVYVQDDLMVPELLRCLPSRAIKEEAGSSLIAYLTVHFSLFMVREEVYLFKDYQ